LPSGGQIRVALLLRKDNPNEYDLGTAPVQVAYDVKIDPTIDEQDTPSSKMNVASWKIEIPSLVPGARYYLQVINHGPSAGALLPLRVIIE
jgi:hypothetical protein